MKINTNMEQEVHQTLKRLVLSENSLCQMEGGHQNFNKFLEHIVQSEQDSIQKQVKSQVGQIEHHAANGWTQCETDCLFELFQKWGSKWTKISHQMPGKTQNCIKNRFYGSLRKVLRKMNKAAKKLVKKFKKQLKFQSITRIIDASEGLFRLKSPLKQESQQLSKKIISIARREQYQMPPNEAEELIKQINKFNMLTRSYKSQKKISTYSKSAPKNKKNQIPNSLTQSQKMDLVSTKQKFESFDFDLEDDNNASSTDHNNSMFLSCQIKKNTQVEEVCPLRLKSFDEQLQISQKIIKNEYDDILEELEQQICSPLNCQDWY